MNLFFLSLSAFLAFLASRHRLSHAFRWAFATLPAHCPAVALQKDAACHFRLAKEERKGKAHPTHKDWRMEIFDSILDARVHWSAAAPKHNRFLQEEYLAILEKHPPRKMQFRYVVFYLRGLPAGVAYFQVLPFLPEKSLRGSQGKPGAASLLAKPLDFLIRRLYVSQNHNLLLCGNLLLTGANGFWFREKPEAKACYQLLDDALALVKSRLEEEKQQVNAVFIKDASPGQRMEAGQLASLRYREFTFQPNMVLDVPRHWLGMDHYIAALASKYRVRYKKARSLTAGLTKRELSLEDMQLQQDKICSLLCEIVDKQEFKMVELDPGYLAALKATLGDRFRVFGYYLDGELVGFFTTVDNGQDLEAHFLGFSEPANRSARLYLNFLYDILEIGIRSGASRIVYARTALEIKSSVGATPEVLYSYIRAEDCLLNKLLPSLVRYLQPADDWVPRNPFK